LDRVCRDYSKSKVGCFFATWCRASEKNAEAQKSHLITEMFYYMLYQTSLHPVAA